MHQTIASGSDDDRGLVQMILSIGTMRFGMPFVHTRETLTSIAEMDRLKLLLYRVCEIESWDHLLTY